MSLPLAAVHRELVIGSGSNLRVAAGAASSAREAVEDFIQAAAQEAAKIIKLQKKATVTRQVLVQVFVKDGCGIKLDDLSSSKRAGETRGLPKAGVSRLFKEQLPAGSRLSGDAGETIAAAGEAYIRLIGKRAAILVKAGKRSTIQKADVIDSRKLSA